MDVFYEDAKANVLFIAINEIKATTGMHANQNEILVIKNLFAVELVLLCLTSYVELLNICSHYYLLFTSLM